MPPERQRTIAASASLAGKGLFLGRPVQVTFRPAPADHGVVFVRTDLGGARIPATIRHVVKRARRTTLRSGQATVDTCEHCLSALAGLGIDNVAVELDGPELPGLDGSAKPFVDALQAAGFQELEAARQRLIVSEPVYVRQDEATLAVVPSDEPGMQVVYELDYSGHPAIGRQVKCIDLSRDDYAEQLAPARTFVLEAEAKALLRDGFGKHLSAQDMLVIGDAGPLGGNRLRFDDEPVRHKLVDLIGDLSLLGAPIQGRVIASRSGHALNHALVRELVQQFRRQTHRVLATQRGVFDVRRLLRILPQRYPMLLVDRVVEIDGSRRALGVKNVTMNEPFFQGHFPGTPIMPGVLVVEAMAQLSGVLIGQTLEHEGKLAMLLSLDRVKLRKPVVPGDQLMLEAESVRVRSAVAHMRCRAYVGEDLVAEAELKFLIVDGSQI